MITFQDCLELCDASEETVEAIASHEHLCPIVAAELACCLLKSGAGITQIQRFLMDEIGTASGRGRWSKVRKLHYALEQVSRYEPYPAAVALR